MQIIVDFNKTHRGMQSMRYANQLARALKTVLIVRVPRGEQPRSMMRAFIQVVGTLSTESVQIESEDAAIFAESENENSERIFVTTAPTIKAAREHGISGKVHLLFSFEEDGGRVDAEHPTFCLPFGDRDDTMRAVRLTCELAKPLHATVVATHTTYRRPDINSKSAFDHMAAGARAMYDAVYNMVERGRMHDDLCIEAVDIPTFVIEAAARHEACLIVVTCGDTLVNGNADQLVARSHIPVLVAA